MNVYLIVKVGIYNHDIFGAFEKQANAIERAIMLSRMENDDYHRFEVVQLTLDETKKVKFRKFQGQCCDQDTIFSIKKLVLDSREDEEDGYEWNLNLLEI